MYQFTHVCFRSQPFYPFVLFFFIPYLAVVYALPLSIQVVYFRFVLLLHATTTGLYSVQLFMCRHRSQRYRCRMVFPFNFCVLPRTHANNWSEWPYKYVTSLTIIVRAFLVLKTLRRFYINCVSVCVFLSCYRGFAGALVGTAAATGILILNLFIFVSVVCYFWCHWLHLLKIVLWTCVVPFLHGVCAPCQSMWWCQYFI